MRNTSGESVDRSGFGKKPKPWIYLLFFILLVVLWMILLELIIRPAFLMTTGFPVVRRLALYLLPPFAVTALAYGLHGLIYSRRERRCAEQAAQAEAAKEVRAREERDREESLLARQRFSLEILAVGLGLEYLRQAQVWDELQARDRFEPVLSEDPEDYPDTAEDKERAQRQRESEALEEVLDWLNEEWAIPTFLVGPALENPHMLPLLESNLREALDLGGCPGRRFHLVDCLHGEDTDRILQTVFDFMDRHAEVPAVLVVAEDGVVLRHGLRSEDAPDLLSDGPRRDDEAPETVVAVLLGRKDRLASMKAYLGGSVADEDVMKPYWEKDQLARSAGAFTTTELLPSAWSQELIEAFSNLPVLGHLHRPQFVHFQAGMGDGSRADAFKAAWLKAMENLGEGGKPAQVFYDVGAVTQGRKLVPLSRGVREIDPDFDAFDMGINLHRRLGDAGAASPLLGLALAATASYREGQASASVFLRREDGASLLLVRPSDAEASQVPETEGAFAEA